ncbi:MAG: biopolymer transporter ExbD, partial [Bacteroidales bacterium]|nr:biopolymer transporter ExbD [Bacteroidales bacterium]
MARRGIPEINAGSMADIAFLLLIFFLVATTMDIDTGISRLLPPMPEDEELDEDQEIRERNVFVVLINKDDDLFVEDGFYDVGELKEMTKQFFLNPNDEENLSEKREL